MVTFDFFFNRAIIHNASWFANANQFYYANEFALCQILIRSTIIKLIMKRIFLSLLLFFLFFVPSFVRADGELQLHAKVIQINSQTQIDGVDQAVFEAVGENGVNYTIDTSQGFVQGLRYDLNVGDRVILQIIENPDGSSTAFLKDVVRTNSLIWIFAFFAIMTTLVGRLRGVFALFGLGITLAIIFGWLYPTILAGGDSVSSTVIASVVILAVNMALSHGIGRGTQVAFGSTVIGLVLALVFAKVFVGLANLSGLASEEASLLALNIGPIIIPQGILLAGIILGAVGVLDDITITQGETVAELASANPSLDRKELYKRAMNVGRHHIASTVNTLVLAYAGAATPLFLLFLATRGTTVAGFINEEVVSEEIIRTLAGTCALVLTVPISTWFATLFQKR